MMKNNQFYIFHLTKKTIKKKLTTGLNSLNTTHGTVFLVHVVGTGTRIVTDPDTKVLDLFRTLLGDLFL